MNRINFPFGSFFLNSFMGRLVLVLRREGLSRFLVVLFRLLRYWRVKKDKKQDNNKKPVSTGSRMILRRLVGGRFPDDVYRGRERVSMLPRWISTWTTTLVVGFWIFSTVGKWFGLPTYYFDPFMLAKNYSTSYTPTPTYVVLPDYPINTPISFNSSSYTATPYPTFTPYPTLTPYPTQTPLVDWLRGSPVPTQNSFSASQINFVFSYYYPPLVSEGGDYSVNCHPDNWLLNKQGKVTGCKDITASGQPWSIWLLDQAEDTRYKGGIAVSYYPDTFSPLYPMGSEFIVDSPPQLAGRYKVVDICPACDDYYKTDGVLFIDFLSDGLPEGVNFWDTVKVLEAIYP